MSKKAVRETLTKSIKDAISLKQAAGLVPGNPHVATLWRWGNKGVGGHKLATFMVGGRRMVTLEALEDFLQRLNAGIEPDEAESDSEFSARARQAGKVLESIGA